MADRYRITITAKAKGKLVERLFSYCLFTDEPYEVWISANDMSAKMFNGQDVAITVVQETAAEVKFNASKNNKNV